MAFPIFLFVPEIDLICEKKTFHFLVIYYDISTVWGYKNIFVEIHKILNNFVHLDVIAILSVFQFLQT